MKNLFLAAALLTGFAAHAQITPERIHDGSGGYVLRLTNGDYKYAFTNLISGQVTLYNLNHSVYKTFAVPSQGSSYYLGYVGNITDALFDTNAATLEYVATFYPSQFGGTLPPRCVILSEGGSQLALLDSSSFVSIFTTPAGTKLLAPKSVYNSSGYPSREYTRVYSLPGQLPLRAAAPAGPELPAPYPNPAQEARVFLPYAVPAGTLGTLRVYDAAGRPVRTYQVDSHVSRLELGTQELAPGVYLYRVQTPTGTTPAQRFIVP